MGVLAIQGPRGEREVRVLKHIHVQDKSLFFNCKKHVLFHLDAQVFDAGTAYNTPEALRALKVVLFSVAECDSPFLTLFSSPVNAVTLPDQGRIKADIPSDAAFVSFCYPSAVETVSARSELAKGCNEASIMGQYADVGNMPRRPSQV